MSTPFGHLALAATVEPDQLHELEAQMRALSPDADFDVIRRAYDFAELRHRGQRRNSGEAFITHPIGVATICAQLGMDAASVAAALLHDTVEDTPTRVAEVQAEFGEEVAALVDGVTKLSKISFQSREERQAETYRKLVVSMSRDVRVLIVKLCDRLHNMRTLSYLGKDKQVVTAQETLEIYAPLAHRLGIQSLKWELEDLAFQTLHPRRYREIQQMVNQRRTDREAYIVSAGAQLADEIVLAGVRDADITGRAKHFYSIYEKMTRKGKAFNEIYDLTALRVTVESVQDCYAVVGVVHSLWKPMPGRFKDYIAMPKLNMYQSLHTTVVGPTGSPLEIQIRTAEMHRTAEFGVAAHWRYKREGPASAGTWDAWVSRMMDWQRETPDSKEFMDGLRSDLYEDEVYVFTPRGELRALPTGATPLDFAYDVHTDVGHRCVGAKVNDRIVPLSHVLRTGDFVEILTSKAPRGPSRDWLTLATTGKARSKIRAFFRREGREDAEHHGREALQDAMRRAGLPSQKLANSALLAEVMAEMTYRRAEDFYIAIGLNRVPLQTVVNKVVARMKTGDEVDTASPAPTRAGRANRQRRSSASSDVGIQADDAGDLPVRLAECCKPVPGDDIMGYVSLARRITVHRTECRQAQPLIRNAERLVDVRWSGHSTQSFLVDLAVDGWDRTRLLEDLSRTLSEHGANIISAQCHTDNQAIRNRFSVEVGDIDTVRHLLSALRNIESVFDAYRVTPGR